MTSVKNPLWEGTHVIGCKGVRHLIGCRRPPCRKNAFVNWNHAESQKSAHKCREIYKLKALRQMRVWQFKYQCNNFQRCNWWKLQISDNLYLCEFLLHIFKTRNICVRITNMFTNLILICDFFFFTYIWIEAYLCVLWKSICVSSHIYKHLPKYICESFSFMCAFIHYETVLAP